MKSNIIFRIITLVIFMGVFTQTTFAQQTGKIAGKITDKKTGETLVALTIRVDNSSKTTLSDVEGRYAVANLAPGKYAITFSYLGYQPKNITDIDVTAGNTTNLDIIMEEAASSLGEVVITSSVRLESVSSLYAQQKSSVRISDGISSDIIRRSPDRNTGEVIKRISGASMQDNKFVVVRGLSDRYNSTLMNNTPLPSSEPDRKAFSFDIIPSSMIDQVLINKTAASDLPGDFAGGVINIVTKDFPDQQVLDINYGAGYNTQSTFKAFKGSQGGSIDFLGFDDGTRKLPSSFPGTTAFSGLTESQRVTLTRKLKNTWGVKDFGTALPTQNIQVTYGNSFMQKNDGKIGMLLSLSYRNGMNINEQRRADYAELTQTSFNDFSFDFNDRVYRNTVNLGGLANFAYNFKKTKIALKNLYNRSFEDSYTDRTGASFEDPDFDQRNSQFQVTEKTLLNSTLEGQHLIGQKNYKIDWNLSFSSSSRDQPDLRRIYYTRAISTNDPFEAAIPVGSPSPKNAGRFYSELQDYIYGGTANFTMPFKIKNSTQSLKAGVWNQFRTRNFNARQFGYVIENGNSEVQENLRLPQDEIFSAPYIGSPGFVIDEIYSPSNKYYASGLLNAGYVMLTNSLSDKVKVNWGGRVESYIETLDGRDITGKISVDNNYLDVLPSANIIYSANNKTNFRASYSNTVARAEFRELAPFSFFDFETNNVTIGNPQLKRTRINNFDIKVEHYPSNGQIFSASVFYKDFKDPIEQVFNPGSTAASKTASFQNATNATVYGVEIEAREKLGFLGGESWDKFTVYGNFSYIRSDVNLKRSLYPNINSSRPLQGQSPYLINAGIQYSGAVWNINTLYNRIGRRINIVGFGQYANDSFQYDYPDIVENPRDIIDLQISRKLLKTKGEIKLNISDILNQNGVLYQDINGDKTYSKTKDQTISSIKYGTNVSLSFGYKF